MDKESKKENNVRIRIKKGNKSLLKLKEIN